MKKIITLAIMSSVLGLGSASAGEPLPVKASIPSFLTEKDFILYYCQEFAPAYVPLIQSSYSSPNSWVVTVNGQVQKNAFNAQDREQVIGEFETIIHETTHLKNSIYGFLVDPVTYLELTTQERNLTDGFFKSDLIDNVVSLEAQQKIFRYKTYVSKASSVAANVKGIVGLMDEYSAYQNGCSGALMAYDNALKEKDTALAVRFFNQALATHFAYYEFNIFMGAYVKYAKLYQPKVYNDIIGMVTLKKAYTLNTKQFLAALQTIESAATRLKKHYSEVKYNLDYYNKTYVDFSKEYMKNFSTELAALKITQ